MIGKGGGEDAMIGMRIRTPRKQLVAALFVVVVFNDNAGGGHVVVLMVGCLVEFVKGFVIWRISFFGSTIECTKKIVCKIPHTHIP